MLHMFESYIYQISVFITSLLKEQTLMLHTEIQQQKVSSEHLAVCNTSSATSDIIYYKKDIFCITKLSKLFPHLPLFHIIGASAQSLEELIQTFRCHGRAEKREQLNDSGAECQMPTLSSLCWEEKMFLFLSQSKILGSKFVSREQFSSLGFCIFPPNC